MSEFDKLPLELENKNLKLYIKREKLLSIKKELETFTKDISSFNSPNFPREVLFPYELKSNNLIEGYNQDLSSIIKIINNPYLKTNKLDNEYQRIFNLFRGYEFILDKPEINEDNLSLLYKRLSKNILEESEQLKPLNKYRDVPVYIHYSSDLSKSPDQGVDHNKLEYHMNQLFEYINSNNDNLTKEELFFKSQIIHFYFVYLHPYLDINGRTSRTTSLWFLNNNESYPYTLFNRYIPYNKSAYYSIIREVKNHKNITPFIEYIAKGTKLELEKEYIVSIIEENSKYKLDQMNKQLLLYILSNNSNNTLLDIASFYNRYNPKRSIKYINDELLIPLFDKGILLRKNDTSKNIDSINHNYNYSINDKLITIDKSKIKRLNLEKYTKH